MTNGNFSLTANFLKGIFVEAIDSTVNDISNFFQIVDEEPITFTFILKAKSCISEKIDRIKELITKDIIEVIQTQPTCRVDQYGIKNYVEHNLVVDVVGHNRHFESSKSGSDFGLLFSLPKINKSFGHINIRPRYNGILIQAKRNALSGKGPHLYGTLSKKFDYTEVRDFMAIALYKYEAGKLANISFLKPITKDITNEKYKKHLNDILRKLANTENITAQEFFSLFIKKKIGTCDQAKIETYIKDGNLPVFELKIYFKDEGGGIGSYARVTNPTEQVQTIKVRGG